MKVYELTFAKQDAPHDVATARIELDPRLTGEFSTDFVCKSLVDRMSDRVMYVSDFKEIHRREYEEPK